MKPDVYGELTADGERILLVPSSGNVYDLRTGELALLTPLVKVTEDKQALTLPVSWPAVTQLAFTYGGRFKPGERLSAWIDDQIARRTPAEGGLSIRLPEGLTPRPYQVDGARQIAAVGSCLITDEPGTGKTITTILGLLERAATG